MTKAMNAAEPKRLWGIWVIAAVYAVATLLCGALFFIGTSTGKVFGLILAPVCLIVSVGIACRINLIRKILVGLLCLAVVGDGLFLVFFAAAYVGVVSTPPHMSPLRHIVTIVFRLGPTLTMVYYLLRSDVRQAFMKLMPNQAPHATSAPAPGAASSAREC